MLNRVTANRCMRRHIWFVMVASAAAFSCAAFMKNLANFGSRSKIAVVDIQKSDSRVEGASQDINEDMEH